MATVKAKPRRDRYEYAEPIGAPVFVEGWVAAFHNSNGEIWTAAIDFFALTRHSQRYSDSGEEVSAPAMICVNAYLIDDQGSGERVDDNSNFIGCAKENEVAATRAQWEDEGRKRSQKRKEKGAGSGAAP